MTAGRHALLHGLFKWASARSRGYVTRNPCLETELPARTKSSVRGLSIAELGALLEAGLVDEIGYVSDAKARVAERLGGSTPRFVSYAGGGSLLRSVFSPDFVGAAIRKAFPEAAAPPAPRAGL